VIKIYGENEPDRKDNEADIDEFGRRTKKGKTAVFAVFPNALYFPYKEITIREISLD
jgi:hypothetical protein